MWAFYFSEEETFVKTFIMSFKKILLFINQGRKFYYKELYISEFQ